MLLYFIYNAFIVVTIILAASLLVHLLMDLIETLTNHEIKSAVYMSVMGIAVVCSLTYFYTSLIFAEI